MSDFLMKSTFLIVSIFLWCMKISAISLTRMAGDSLKPGDMLNSTTKLCSAANTSCLQFENIGGNGTFGYLVLRNIMVARWYLWVGNRNDPVLNNSGELTLDHSGELKIVSQDKSLKVLYSPIQPINDTKAILLDSGNFVLQQLHPNGSKIVLWQSFDYPTDVLLPGMKLGVNYKTNHTWSLVSWTTGNPASGDFTLEWEPIGRELIIRRRGVIYWKSGLLRNNTSFDNIPNELTPRFFIEANEDEGYFALTAPKSTEKISFLGLTSLGGLSDGNRFIGKTDICYGFNSDGGCQLYDVPRCWPHAEIVSGYINFTDIQTSKHVKNDTNSSLTRVDCQRRCWKNCDCVGYSTTYNNGTGCTFLYGHVSVITTLHFNDDYGLIVRQTEPLHHKGKKKWIWIGVMIASSLFIISLLILCLASRKRKFQLKVNRRQNSQTAMLHFSHSNEFTTISDPQENAHKEHDLRIFSYISIIEATTGFSSENKLGEGGFGSVYKGILSTGNVVAIKRLSKASKQGAIEFTNELTLISELQHMNLIRLLGYCIHEEERILIYEFMPNRSLDFFLFDSTQSKLLDWQKRINIIEGIAQGLLYLHKYSRFKVIHRDLKASNILLDENMNPKISDFGMARMFTQQESEANTLRIVGTYGYISPEYAMEGVFYAKSDVYSFGVLLLEIISGRRNNIFYNDNGPSNLVAYAWKLWKEGAALQLMDPVIIGSYVDIEVLRCIHIGILCVEQNPDDRPTMSNIISILTNKNGKLSLPKRPAFYTRTNMVESKIGTKELEINTINEVTLSELDAR